MSDILNIHQFTFSTNARNVDSCGKFMKNDPFSFEYEGEKLEGIIVAIGVEESCIVLQVVVGIRSTYLIKLKK